MSEVYGLFAGVGAMILFMVMAYFFYQIARSMRTSADYEEKVMSFQGIMVDKVAAKHGIDLPTEILKNKLTEKIRKRSFQRRLEEQIIKDLFEKEEKVKK